MADPLDPFDAGLEPLPRLAPDEVHRSSERALELAKEVGRKPPEKKEKRRKPKYSECWPEVPPAERIPLQVVTIRVERQCHFKEKGDHPETGKTQRGCARCGKAKNWEGHLGAPKSFNAFGSGANIHAWQGDLTRWKDAIGKRLREAGLPKGLGKVRVDARVCFGDRTERDQENFRPIIAKAFGDILVDEGWLYGDDWSRYEFGQLERADPTDAPQVHKGENWTEFAVFPSWPADPDAPEGALF